MKKIYKDKILNISGTDVFDQTFFFELLIPDYQNSGVEVVYIRDLLESYKNEEILKKVSQKPAMYSEVYSPKDELVIFTELFENALKNNKKIHIVGVTLGEEIKMLEAYYESLGFLREDINAFDVDFSVPLVTVSCHIENLIWKGSDYKSQGEKIFFTPPIRESGQNKALFKGITRGVIAGIEISPDSRGSGLAERFFTECITSEKILALNLAKVLRYNLEEVGIGGELREMRVEY
ncbi:hypothetical protein LAT59_04560 [Candidatus Gracilibacteria bacterium]|nr:hypothetical protein [Candidatus Gracilibacteria bacterium]